MDAGPDTRARMVQHLMDDTAEDTLELLQYFRHLVTCTTSPSLEEAIEEMAEKSCLPKIVAFLHHHRLELQVSRQYN